MIDLVEVRPAVYADQLSYLLRSIRHPDGTGSIVDHSLVASLQVIGQHVIVSLVQSSDKPLGSFLVQEVRQTLLAVPKVQSVEVRFVETSPYLSLEREPRIPLH